MDSLFASDSEIMNNIEQNTRMCSVSYPFGYLEFAIMYRDIPSLDVSGCAAANLITRRDSTELFSNIGIVKCPLGFDDLMIQKVE